ncbi:MAG: bifunctional riboflavin kinase/FAD synthetase [Bacteroidetes bacterium]|nr:bifunctional riboflavin kinase/FAD synthetase [Bacteroidota bacterium]
MRVYRGLDVLPDFRNPVITIGTFDGVHVGHTSIINRLCTRANEVNGESVIITFEPHPRLVLSNHTTPIELLYSLDEKIEALSKMNVDNLVVVPFTKVFAELSAKDYIEDFLVHHFKPHTFIIGYDHHFGKNRQGNFDLLNAVKGQYGFNLEEIPVQEITHVAVSSTKIREALHRGDITQANTLLGKPFVLHGQVVHGEQKGRLLGFPTANLQIMETHKLIPANGVYAVFAEVNHRMYKGMMNIGIRPTINNLHQRSIEVHMFDFDEEIYQQTIGVQMLHRLRDEKKFESIEGLIQQLHEDKSIALQIL